MDFNKIGKFLSLVRKDKGFTQEELAERLGVSSKSISRWENGRNMPDASLYKELCKCLDISIEELINGEYTDSNNKNTSFEKAIISTIDLKEKSDRKLINTKKILIMIFFVLLIFVFLLYKKMYPKIEIYNVDVVENSNDNLEIVYESEERKIYYFGISSLQLINYDNYYFDLRNSLKNRQVNIDDLRHFLDIEVDNGYVEKFILYDGGTTIYKTNKMEVIFCNTLDGNKDVYIGKLNFRTDLKDSYCGKDEDPNCYFIRTYYILNISEDDDYDFINVTLREFQGNTVMVRIPRIDILQVGKNYEFKFRTYENFEDNISNIFLYSTLIDVSETDKMGLLQVNDSICISSY